MARWTKILLVQRQISPWLRKADLILGSSGLRMMSKILIIVIVFIIIITFMLSPKLMIFSRFSEQPLNPLYPPHSSPTPSWAHSQPCFGKYVANLSCNSWQAFFISFSKKYAKQFLWLKNYPPRLPSSGGSQKKSTNFGGTGVPIITINRTGQIHLVTPATAASMSASSKTTAAFLPPSSRDTCKC